MSMMCSTSQPIFLLSESLMRSSQREVSLLQIIDDRIPKFNLLKLKSHNFTYKKNDSNLSRNKITFIAVSFQEELQFFCSP
jgi:hypothetical protein